jgi:hypothetical protein
VRFVKSPSLTRMNALVQAVVSSVNANPASSFALEAIALLDMWHSMAATHVSLGSNCACGMGGVSLQLSDFEEDLIDFVLGRAERERRSDVTTFVNANALNENTGQPSVTRLLMAASTAHPASSDTSQTAQFVVDSLSKTIRSFARLHAG